MKHPDDMTPEELELEWKRMKAYIEAMPEVDVVQCPRDGVGMPKGGICSYCGYTEDIKGKHNLYDIGDES